MHRGEGRWRCSSQARRSRLWPPPRQGWGWRRLRTISRTMIGFLLAAAVIVPAGQSFTCTPVRVWDGDGPVWCAEGPHVRLAGIAARERDGTCRGNQPCPDADSMEARDALVRLVGIPVGSTSEGHILVQGPAMQCLSAGNGTGNRTAAWCVSPRSGDISCAMVADGWALKWPVYWREHRCAR